jgi:hypothetical protein
MFVIDSSFFTLAYLYNNVISCLRVLFYGSNAKLFYTRRDKRFALSNGNLYSRAVNKPFNFISLMTAQPQPKDFEESKT